MFSIVLHVGIKVKIVVVNHRRNKKVQPKIGPMFSKNVYIKETENDNLTSYVANLACCAIIAVLVGTSARMTTVTTENLNIFPNYILVLFVHLIGPTLFVLILTTSFYRKRTMRAFLAEELKRLYQNISERY